MATLPIAAGIARLARRQHGLVTTAQLVDLGVTSRQVEGWTGNGRLERVLPGVLRLGGAPTSREQSFHSAVLWAGPDALVSHRAAGELWGFDSVTAARPEISVPISVRKRSALVVVHQTRAPVSERRTRHGLPMTSPERTLIDLAGSLRAEQLEVAFESARRERLVTTASVDRALARIGARGRDGSGSLRGLLTALATEPPAESALEVFAARLLRASDVPTPQRQVEVVAYRATYRLDFAWPDTLVALECDGRKWHEIESDFERDRQRWSAIQAASGYRIVWATWKRVREHPERLVAQLRRLMFGS